MAQYAFYLNQKREQIATAAASETGITVEEYLKKVINEHLNHLENKEEKIS
jgi:hypothetical protein